jgi:hypothetical protein
MHLVFIILNKSFKSLPALTNYVQGDQKVCVHQMITVKNTQKYFKQFQMAITEYIRNVDRAILNTVFEKHSSACQKMSGDWRGTL